MLLMESGLVTFQGRDKKILLFDAVNTCKTGAPVDPKPKQLNTGDKNIRKLLAFEAGLLAAYNEDGNGFIK